MPDPAPQKPTPLLHYSSAPLAEVLTVEQFALSHFARKPRGLWVSVGENDDGWRAWCIGNDFGLNCLTHAHEIELAADANVLWLRGPASIDAFTTQFTVDTGDRYYKPINWPEVASQWDALFIAPYVWERRLSDHTGWYYGWDCASGCIWNARVVRSIKLREIVPVPTADRSEAA